MTPRVAVVGAGLAGLACARALEERDVRVTVLDKGRSVGGRLATRRIPPHTFDLGAQYFTARGERFQRVARSWLDDGVCAPWRGRIVAVDGTGDPPRPVEAIDRLVGTPDMNALARHLARGLHVRTGHRVESIARHDGTLTLRGTVAPAGVTLGPAAHHGSVLDDLGSYDCVVVCLPAPQAALLLAPVSARLAAEARAVTLDPCLAVALAAGEHDERALRGLDFDGAFVGREGTPSASALAWVARDSSKPGRPAGERWVLHASASWSRAWWAAPVAEVTEAMLTELSMLFDLGHLRPALTWVHRWSLARAATPLACGALFDDEGRVGLGGDWASGGRIEGAFLSGLALADRVLAEGVPRPSVRS